MPDETQGFLWFLGGAWIALALIHALKWWARGGRG